MNRVQDFQIEGVRETRQPRSRLGVDGYGTTGTRFMVLFDGRWRRVYAMCYGNGASYYVQKKGITFFLNLEDVLDHTKN